MPAGSKQVASVGHFILMELLNPAVCLKASHPYRQRHRQHRCNADNDDKSAADNAATTQTMDNDADSNAAMPTMDNDAITQTTDNNADDGQ